MLAFKYLADYAGIDWATDLAGAGLYIPHQKRVQEIITAALAAYLTAVVDDTAPVLGGNLDANNKIINDVREINFQYNSSGGDNGPRIIQENDDWLSFRNDNAGSTFDTHLTVGAIHAAKVYIGQNEGNPNTTRAYFQPEPSLGSYIDLWDQTGLARKRLKVATPTEAEDAVTKAYADGLSGSSPSFDDQHQTVTSTTIDEDTTGVSISNTPVGRIDVFIGTEMHLSYGAKTGDCYFSGDGGTTARAQGAVVAGDTLYWMQSIAGFNLVNGTHFISLKYNA
jgi:hypothetical protein